MIVAGIGCKKGVSPAAVLVAVDAALAEHRRERADISRLATGTAKRDEAAIVIAAGTLGVPLHYVGDAALAEVAGRLITSSNRSADATGSPSLSEASALAAAGENGRLLGPRVVAGQVTCALAAMDRVVAEDSSTPSVVFDHTSPATGTGYRTWKTGAASHPDPVPPHKGEGTSALPFLPESLTFGTSGTAAKSPSPLWGGVRGGGKFHMRLPGVEGDEGNSPAREARP